MSKPKPLPPLQVLLKLFDYNPEEGTLIWKHAKDKRIPGGKIAGWINKAGYLTIRISLNERREHFQIHRLIWYIATGNDPGDKKIDHIDGNRLNNKIKNLRLANDGENARNQKMRSDNSSGFKGVNWCKKHNKWVAKIGANNRRRHLGYFSFPELAHMAYCKAAAELHGEFARGA